MPSPTKGNVTNINQVPANLYYQFNHNQNAGSDKFLVIQMSMTNNRSYLSCTYGGQTMNQLYQINRGGLSQRMAFFYLSNPPSGNNILRVNFNNAVWNPISIHARSFINCAGIGNSLRAGGSSTPNNKTINISQDGSLVMTMSCSNNVILTQQIPTGTNRSFTTHNTNKQIATGAISANSGHSTGSLNLRATSAYGNITFDRTEILGIAENYNSSSDFFMVM